MDTECREPTLDRLDDRVRFYLERELGFPLDSFPRAGIAVSESPKRTDEPRHRMLIAGIGHRALATGTPRVVSAIGPVIRTMSVWELFSPLGLAELGRVLQPENPDVAELCFNYTLTSEHYRAPRQRSRAPVKLPDLDTHTPPDDADLLKGPQVLPPGQDFVPAFAIYQDDRQVATSGIRWRAPGFVEIGVGTEEGYRGRGYGRAVVASAAEWILSQGTVACYGAVPANIPSLRIPRGLGFRLAWLDIAA